MTKWLVQMKPTGLDNIIAMVALFRPGPMEFIPDYISRMHGETEVEYRHPLLEPILKSTYGITVYQEQIMYTAINLAGYTASEADNLRKSVAKKKADDLLAHRTKFVEGAAQRGVTKEIANLIFDDWEAFARYGFPKGHAADYGVIAVETAFLKLHYPAEYMTALLSATKHETEKLALYINDARNMGVEVLPPDVNASEWDFTIEDRPGQKPAIRFGLGAIKNVGGGPVEVICQARRKNGPFNDLNDFTAQVDLRAAGKRALESLIKVGAMDKFGSRAAMLEALDRVVAVSSSHFRAAEAGQMSLFGWADSGEEDWTLQQKVDAQTEILGASLDAHPLELVADKLARSGAISIVEAAERMGRRVTVAGVRQASHRSRTSKGDMMLFLTLEDLGGTLDAIFFPEVYRASKALFDSNFPLLVTGVMEMDTERGEPFLRAEKVVLVQ